MSVLKVEHWIESSNIDDIGYSKYWNDEEIEKSKEFYILDGNFSKMENYIKETGFAEDLELCIDSLKNIFNRFVSGTGIDLGAGNLWAASWLLRSKKCDISRLYCLEYSKHRLLKIGPKVLEHYNISSDKVVLVLGSFYELKLANESMDFVLLSSAFHHADDPDKLLSEIKRILKPRGMVIIIGELALNPYKYLVNIYNSYFKHAAKFIISKFMPLYLQQKLFGRSFDTKTFMPRLKTFFPYDPVLGDHYYTMREYRKMFLKHGFRFKMLKRPESKHHSFILALD